MRQHVYRSADYYEVGETVWALRDQSYGDPFNPGVLVRAKVVRANDAWGLTVKFADGRQEFRAESAVFPLSAVDALAILERCARCVDYGQDRCDEHNPNVITFTMTGTTATNWVFTLPYVATNIDYSAAEEDEHPRPHRRRLTANQRARRMKRKRIAKDSRRRNRCT